MPKKGESAQGVDWVAIREEYEAGQLGLREIAKMYGLKSHGAIMKRAAREGWERSTPQKVVTALVTKVVTTGDTGHQTDGSPAYAGPAPRTVIAVFQRAMEVVTTHRKDLAKTRKMLSECLHRVDAIIELANEGKTRRKLTLGEEMAIVTLLDKAASILAKIIPMERKAFGFSDDGPTEFDSFTDEEMGILEAHIRKAIGKDGSE